MRRKRVTTPFKLAVLIPLIAIAVSVFPYRAAFAQSAYDNYIYEDEGFLDRLQSIKSDAEEPFTDLPPDHWAYRAVKDLADAGLLEGYNGQLFNGDQVVTRYEMAMLVSKLLDSYLEWQNKGGRATREQYPTRVLPSDTGTQSGAPLRSISPPSAVIQPSRRVTFDLPSLGSMALDRSGPATLGEVKPGGQTDYTGGLTEQMKTEVTDIVDKAVDEKFKDLDMKKIKELEKLVNEFKDELKDMKKELSKQIKETNKIALSNKQEIKKLWEENQRFRITGTDRFFWIAEGPVTGDGCLENDPEDVRCNMRTANLANSLILNLDSKPEKEVSIGGTVVANTYLGGKRTIKGNYTKDPGFDSSGTKAYDYWLQQTSALNKGYLEGTNTALMLSSIYVHYDNPSIGGKDPKNFKLRSLYLGDMSLMISPFTVMGKPLQGISTTLQLNDYSIIMFGAREKLHQRTLFSTNDQYNTKSTTNFINEDLYDRYKYGVSVETNLFGNPASRVNFSRVFMFDNKDTNYPGCDQYGKWIDLEFNYDEYTYKLPDTDIGNFDIFCAPPVKNSISSVFIIYPFENNVSIMGEYAHSTYYKPGYTLLKPFDRFGTGSGLGVSDVNNPDLKFEKWWPVREENDQDDGFIVIFNYNKGPLTLFPIGYLHLGPNFNADIDISSFTGGDFDITSAMSIIPISIKSIDGVLGSLKYEFQNTNKTTYSTLYAVLGENEKMYFDPGALALGMSNSAWGTKSALGLLNTAILKINNRTEKLSLNVWTNSIKHYLSDKMLFTAGFTKVGAEVPMHCVDANQVTINSEFLNSYNSYTEDKVIGNGITDCVNDSGDVMFGLKFWMTAQSYQFDWDTSKRAHMTTGFSITETNLVFKYSKQVEDIINGLVPKGKKYDLFTEVKYKLTSSTRLKLYYSLTYDLPPYGYDQFNPDDPKAWKFPVIDYQKFMFMVESNF